MLKAMLLVAVVLLAGCNTTGGGRVPAGNYSTCPPGTTPTYPTPNTLKCV